MIIIQEKNIEQIPILEIVQEENKDKMIPTVVCYHGWTGSKENCIHYGAMLAKNGMRAILPDQLYHGERKTSELNGFELWENSLQISAGKGISCLYKTGRHRV